MNIFNTKTTHKEELDYMNKRLVYVNDLYEGFTTTGMSGVKDNFISTDQVISLFDGGYRLGLIELSQIQKYEFEKFKKRNNLKQSSKALSLGPHRSNSRSIFNVNTFSVPSLSLHVLVTVFIARCP